MEGFAIFLVVVFLLMPIVALVTAIVAANRANKLELELHRLQDRLRKLEAPRPTVSPPEQKPRVEPEPRVKPTPEHKPAPAPAVKAQQVAERIRAVSVSKQVSAEPPAAPRADRIGWEQKLGAQLPVWIGGIALALAGLFLVRFVAQQGLLTPPVRLAMAGSAGLVMVALAQWLKRNWSQIAQALAAAAVATWYAATFSAVSVHHLLDARLGFVLIGAITAGAVVLSLRHGPFVALLGIVGGFVMPGLLGVTNFTPVQLFGYLIVLEVALTALTRRRNWWPLTLVTMAFAYGWALLWMALWFDADYANVIGLFVLASAGAFVAASWNVRRTLGGWPIMRVMPYLAVVVGLLIAGKLVHVGGFEPTQWVYLGLLGGGAMLLGRLRSDYFPLAAAAATITATMVLLWADDAGGRLDATFSWTVLDFAAIFGGGAYIALFGDRHPSRWATMSVVATLAFTLIGYCHIDEAAALTTMPWWSIAACLAGAYALGSTPILLRRHTMHEGDRTLAMLLIGVSAFAAMALTLYFETGWLTAALAIETLAIAAVAWKLRVPELRLLVNLGAGAVATRLLLNPAVFDYVLSEHVLLNGLWYIYGIPIACMLGAAWISQRDNDAALSERLGAIAAALGFALLGLLVRHGYHPGQMDRGGWGVYELSTCAIVWGAYGAALLAAHEAWPRRVLAGGGRIAAGVAMIVVIGGSCLAMNPLWERADVGATAVFNGLLYLYGVPALLAAGVTWLGRRWRDEAMTMIAGLGALVLTFVLISLQVRQAFWGADLLLRGQPPTHAEWYSYSAAWLAFAGALLAGGVIGGSVVLRYASLAVMLATVVKVFAFDTRHLADLWRVLSFLGLGVCLLGLAWVYQRFIFGMNRPTEDSAT